MVELILLAAAAAFVLGAVLFAVAEREQMDALADIAMGMISLASMAIGAIITGVTAMNLIANPPEAPLLWLTAGLWATGIGMVLVGLVLFGLGVTGLRVALDF